MPGQPTPVRHRVRERFDTTGQQIRDQQLAQTRVIVDPTRVTGDPAHNNATVVMGFLLPICGINAWGIASFMTGRWIQTA